MTALPTPAPVQTPVAARTQIAFRVLMAALASPGEAFALPGGHEPFALIGETLLDLETSYAAPDGELGLRLADTGARARPPHGADFVFFPVLDDAALDLLSGVRCGDALEPERAATVIIGTAFGGEEVVLSGPGIPGIRRAALGLNPAFWTRRRDVMSYPLGWDAFLVGGSRVVGLPRTTLVVD